MPAPKGPIYTDAHVVRDDGTVEFTCSRDSADFPWLELPPRHPIVIQTQNFWTSVGASAALGTLDESKWSALTWTEWHCGDPAAGHATRGTFGRSRIGDDLAFETKLFDNDDRLVVEMRGKGVVFRTRNFEKWREGSKRKAESREDPGEFEYAPRELLGLSEREVPLIAPLVDANGSWRSEALITAENGLMPAHPYFSGSGDHVNAPHLAEVARQVTSLLRQGAAFDVPGGEMDMHRYVELGVPFAIEVIGFDEKSASMEVSQLGKACARLSLKWN